MSEKSNKAAELEDRLDRLVRTQIDFQKEVSAIRAELARLKLGPDKPASELPRPYAQPQETTPPKTPPASKDVRPRPPIRPIEQPPPSFGYSAAPKSEFSRTDPVSQFFSKYTENARADLEKFIGENLISKIGILVLIIGVGIGVKYSIDNNLISPLTRVVIAYLFAFGLVGLAIKLKPKYLNFSAALLSGGMAIMYFVTYFAYSAYQLIGQIPAFVLMVMFTVLTVAAAIFYSRQVIAHIGLVGAYAVPFLLSTDSGNYFALFVYMAVINAGILAVSVKKYWIQVFYTASIFTWLIYLGWVATKYTSADHFGLALVFLALFFGLFLATRLVHAVVHDERDSTEALFAVLGTTFIFYAFAFAVSAESETAAQALTLFSYLAAITAALLFLSFKFIGKPLVYLASACAWAIFAAWCAANYNATIHFEFVLIFSGIFTGLCIVARVAQVITDDNRHSQDGLIYELSTAFIFYAFCFAISNGQLSVPQTWTFFSYLAVMTAGLLIVSFRFLQKYVVFLVFGLTWGIFGAWYLNRYSVEEHFLIAAVFSSVFFSIFYLSTLVHRLVDEDFNLIENSTLVLSNSFLFYGIGYSILNGNESTAGLLGLYTAGHAALHLAVATIIGKIKPAAVDVVQVLTVLILTFASIAIPVQLDGNHVTMAWAIEAALLFWFGRNRKIKLFEYFAYPVMLFAAGSMFIDWVMAYANRTSYPSEFNLVPFANGNFVTGLVFIAAFVFIYAINRDTEKEAAIDHDLVKGVGYVIASVALFSLYNLFRAEIDNYFHLQVVDFRTAGGEPSSRGFRSLSLFNAIWQIDYAMIFIAALAFVNSFRIRSKTLGIAAALLGVLALGVFATIGLGMFYDLRVSYLAGEGDWANVSIRYLSYVVAAVLMFALYRVSQDDWIADHVDTSVGSYVFEAVCYGFCFVVASSELLNLMAQFGIPDGTKLGLSIFWGIYALMLIVIGIAWNKKHLRIAAIALLAITLLKLFFYDAAELDTIPRTILFVSLGLTLLVISFLYNKYKAIIFGFGEKTGE